MNIWKQKNTQYVKERGMILPGEEYCTFCEGYCFVYLPEPKPVVFKTYVNPVVSDILLLKKHISDKDRLNRITIGDIEYNNAIDDVLKILR